MFTVCVYTHVCTMVYVWRPEDDLWELVLSFYSVDPKVVKLGGKYRFTHWAISPKHHFMRTETPANLSLAEFPFLP